MLITYKQKITELITSCFGYEEQDLSYSVIMDKKWPLLVDSKTSEIRKHRFIGRDKEMAKLLDDLSYSRSIRLLIGESGVGKSALLDEFYRNLVENENKRNQVFVGYYSRKESLIAGSSESLIYPFRIVLESLVKTAKESQQINERIDNTVARVKRGLVKFAKDQGIKMGVAIIEDLARKVGLEQTVEVGKEVLTTIGSEKTSLMLAQGYVTDHRDEARESYLNIFRSLADEFKDRRFVLIFDQFEYVGKASIDFFLNFAKFIMLEERFHIIVSFRTDDTILNDPSIRSLFEDLRRKLKNELGGKELEVEGMSADDIGKWIKAVRDISLPMVPDLQRLRENSAGLPILLGEWINSSKNLNYQEIRRDQLCSEITILKKRLNDEEKIKLYKLSILLQPLDEERLARYVEMEDIDTALLFVERLIENRIFDEWNNRTFDDQKNNNSCIWFRHELIQKCFEDQLNNERRKRYHDNASAFFLNLEREKKEATNRQYDNSDDNISIGTHDDYGISIACAYHLHMAERYHEESYNRNKKLAEYASRTGDLDLAERCYKRAIVDATERLGRTDYEMDCLYRMSANVYFTWGRYDEALANYHRLLRHYDKVNDSRMQAYVLNNIAMTLDRKGEYEKAIELYEQSLKIKIQLGDQQGIANTTNNIALVHYRKGEYEKAIELYEQSLKISRQLGDQQGIATTLNNIAMTLDTKEKKEKVGEYEKATSLLANTRFVDTNYYDILDQLDPLIIRTLHEIAGKHYRKGEYEKAIELYEQSLKIKIQLGDQQGIATTLNNIAMIFEKEGEYEKAIELCDQSLKISRQIGDQHIVSLALNNIALVHYRKGEYEKAIELYEQSLKIKIQLGDQQGIATTLNNLSEIYLQKREYQEALYYAIQAYTILKRLRSLPLDKCLNILDSVRDKLGSEVFQTLKEKVERELNSTESDQPRA